MSLCTCTSPELRKTDSGLIFCSHCGNAFEYRAWLESSNSTGAVRLYEELYGLVENYLCTETQNPQLVEHYNRLLAWFVRNKRPDGAEPRPTAPEQTLL